MSEDTTPTEIHTLEELREKFGANSIEYYRKQVEELDQQLDTAKHQLTVQTNRADYLDKRIVTIQQDIANFKQCIFDLVEADEESVEWEKLVGPLSTYFDIELERKWRATVTITATVYFNAMTREKAGEVLDGFYSGEIRIDNRDFEDYEIEDIEHKDLNADN